VFTRLNLPKAEVVALIVYEIWFSVNTSIDLGLGWWNRLCSDTYFSTKANGQMKGSNMCYLFDRIS
jgi:hypothetical protein